MHLLTTIRPLTVAALLVAFVASAQLEGLENTTPGERAKAQTAMMKMRLALSDDQTRKVAAINEKYAEKMEPVIKGSSGPRAKMRTARNIEQQKEAELKQILSAEQFQKFLASKDAMRQELVERMRKRSAHAGQ